MTCRVTAWLQDLAQAPAKGKEFKGFSYAKANEYGMQTLIGSVLVGCPMLLGNGVKLMRESWLGGSERNGPIEFMFSSRAGFIVAVVEAKSLGRLETEYTRSVEQLYAEMYAAWEFNMERGGGDQKVTGILGNGAGAVVFQLSLKADETYAPGGGAEGATADETEAAAPAAPAADETEAVAPPAPAAATSEIEGEAPTSETSSPPAAVYVDTGGHTAAAKASALNVTGSIVCSEYMAVFDPSTRGPTPCRDFKLWLHTTMATVLPECCGWDHTVWEAQAASVEEKQARWEMGFDGMVKAME
jgi:hypothetical protein